MDQSDYAADNSSLKTPHVDFTATIRSRGRVYTTASQREQLYIDDAQHTRCRAVITVPREYDDGSGWTAWDAAEGYVSLLQYGEFTIPSHIMQRLSLREGDTVRIRLEHRTATATL